ncbi:MAG TPA: DUF998 domain-containing protein [Anaerolineales bacterium]
MNDERVFARLAALLGLLGSGLFGFILVILTLLEYSFMRSLGWDPFLAPTLDWPSGLALGPLGWVMTATFILTGSSLLVFALGLRYELSSGGTGIVFLVVAGLAMLGLAFRTDPTFRISPATWHGRLHDLSFVLLGLVLLGGMLALGGSFRRDPRWKDLALYTYSTASLALPAFFIKGAAFYLFLLAILAWYQVIALRLWKLSGL